jgi:hypothetical protein
MTLDINWVVGWVMPNGRLAPTASLNPTNSIHIALSKARGAKI